MKIFQKRYTWSVCMMLVASNVFTHAKPAETVSKPKTTYRDTSISDTKIHAFLSKMHEAARLNDAQKISELFDFTEKCVDTGCHTKKRAFFLDGKLILKSKFMKNYHKIITPKILEIMKKVQFQDVDEVGLSGLMINNGTIWFHPDTGIIAINKR